MNDAKILVTTTFQESPKRDGKFADSTINELNWMLTNAKRLDPNLESDYSKRLVAEIDSRKNLVSAKVDKVAKELIQSPLPINAEAYASLQKSDKVVTPPPPKIAAPILLDTVYMVWLKNGKKENIVGVYTSIDKAQAACTSTKHTYTPVKLDEYGALPTQRIQVNS